MMNPLDMLVLVFIGMSTASLLAICMMFLMKKEIGKKIAFYFLSVQGMLISWMNAKMTPATYPTERALGWALGGLCVVALLLEVCGKSEKYSKIARILVTVSVVLGMVNAFLR